MADSDLLAYEDMACTRRLRIEVRGDRYTPINSKKFVQRIGYRKTSDGVVSYHWAGKRWIRNG